ncbi:MAG: beta-lactamase family protein [Sedimentisphaerales bacterium]|nr:beta-lactamase family protein [Sedimentisphaerales bacterium]
MRNCLAIFLGILVVFSSGCQVSRALNQPIPASAAVGIQDERTQRIAEVIRDTMRKENIAGISVAVVDHGQIVWAQGFGYRDVAKRLPVDTETQFQAGSISKPVTALGVLVLKESGQLDLDKDVNGYFKDWRLDSKWPDKPVTLRLLLCHRAGMVPHGCLGYEETRELPSLLEILNSRHDIAGWLTNNYFGTIKVARPPGSRFDYSTGGYCVVQKAVEDVTGRPFEAVMDELLLQPLAMSRSHFIQPPPEAETNIAHGYCRWHGILYHGRWCVFTQKAGAGLWSTPQDLAKLIVAVQKARAGERQGPISPATAEEFLTPQFDGHMGMGIFLDGEGVSRGFFHSGENLGYFARFGAGVNVRRAWVVMSNGKKDCFNPITKAIAQEFRRLPPDKEITEK